MFFFSNIMIQKNYSLSKHILNTLNSETYFAQDVKTNAHVADNDAIWNCFKSPYVSVLHR